MTGEETDDDGDGALACVDCDDSDGANYPGNAELCDGADNDCNGFDDMGNPGVAGEEADDDGDGQSECQGDCDDSDAMTYPGAPEGLLGSDQDCDGVPGGSGSLSLADASFVGENAGDLSGISVASAGDVDGDGLGDLLIGAHGNDEGGIEAGKTYLIFGSTVAAGGSFDLSLADASFVGETAADYSGGSVASAGDVDGDGLDDLLIMAYGNDSNAGKSYLFFGSTVAAGGPFDLSLADASFLGETAYDYSGVSVASAGDVDGDGLDDLLIGANHNDDGGSNAGKSYLFFGSTVAAGGPFDLSLADASFLGETANDYSGGSVASAGDVDGDGLDDLLIGAYGNDSNAGKSYLFFGSTVAAGGTFNLSTADGSFLGETANDYSGVSVASAGDVDGDGLDDLLIGASGNDDGGSNAGKSYLFFGSTVAAGGPFDLSLADASFLGETANDYSGGSVASAGDVDGDGLDDLLIGAHGNDDGGSNAGKSYLFFGSTVAAGGPVDLSLADASFLGETANDYSGVSVASAGDVDGDGLDDLLIGANHNDEGGSDAGKTYLILSHLPTPDYAGLWSVSPSTSYSCALATVALDHLVIDHVAPYATLPGSPELTMDSSSPQPGLLEGGFVTSSTPDSFAVSRTESLDSGNCTATWSVIGSYTGIDTLSADFTATFAGSCGGCTNQSIAVTATR